MKLTLKLASLIALIALALIEPLALAQAWPVKPIRIINPFPNQNTAQLQARLSFGQVLGELR